VPGWSAVNINASLMDTSDLIHITFLWDVTPWTFVDEYQRCG
jgi:hypothetical protein